MFNLKANKIGIAILSLGMTLQVSAQGKGSDSLLTTEDGSLFHEFATPGLQDGGGTEQPWCGFCR